mmetsp:Transcript_33028/g.78886  ORF Transcript_33028/g.78886 Transcript_33028/m.78886 type:complete len:402 (-) Transcript_33028:1623-2828(-)
MSGSNEDEGTNVSLRISLDRSRLAIPVYLFHFVVLPHFLRQNQSNNFTSSSTEVEDGPLVTPPQDLASLGVASSNVNMLCPGIEPLPYDKANGQSTMDLNIGTKWDEVLELVDATTSPRPHEDRNGGFASKIHDAPSAAALTSTLRPKISSGGEAETKTAAQTKTEPFSTPAEASPTKGTEPKDLSSEDEKSAPWTNASTYLYHAYPPPPSWYYQHQHYYYPPPPLPPSFRPLNEGRPESYSLALSTSTPVNHDNLNSPLLHGRSHKQRELYNRPPAQYILDLSDDDVVCGRGGAINKVRGNIRFRRLINEYRHQYMSASKIVKPMIVRHVLDRVKPGRFLVKFSQGYLECTEERVRSIVFLVVFVASNCLPLASQSSRPKRKRARPCARALQNSDDRNQW